MNQNLKNYYKNIITYDLLTKNNYINNFQIPKINEIYLNIGFKEANIEKKKLTTIIVLLKLITNQFPKLTKSKKNNIQFKIKKGSIIGCKVTIRKKNIYFFLEKLLFFISPNILLTNLNLNKNSKNILNFNIKNILQFFELKTEFLKFTNIPSIDVSIHTNTKNINDLIILLNYMYILKK